MKQVGIIINKKEARIEGHVQELREDCIVIDWEDVGEQVHDYQFAEPEKEDEMLIMREKLEQYTKEQLIDYILSDERKKIMKLAEEK